MRLCSWMVNERLKRELPVVPGRVSIVHACPEPPAENHLWRDALYWRARPPRLLLGLSLQPLDRDQPGPMARGSNIEAVYKTLVTAGVTFLPETDEGVGVRGKHKSKRGK
jgi:hypothetical protein